jgi:hypothetical protein
MATCPRCGGFLSDNHHCVGLWRRRMRSVVAMFWGAVLSIFMLYAVSDHPSGLVVSIGAVSGIVLGRAVWGIVSR